MKYSFIHTSDWQLGMRRWFLGEEGQARYSQARIDVIEKMGRVAHERGCGFIVAAGDNFESNMVSDITFRRAEAVFAHLGVPLVLLPGNHDPASPDSILSRLLEDSSAAKQSVIVLDTAEPVEVIPGVEVVGAPLKSKAPASDLVAEACAALEPIGSEGSDCLSRVLLAHGQVESRSNEEELALISLDSVNAAISKRVADYVAFGDTHSTMQLDERGRVWFSGSPEPTDFREIPGGGGENASGNVLLVTVEVPDHPESVTDSVAADAVTVEVEAVPLGVWRFEAITRHVDGTDDVKHFVQELEAYPDKPHTVIKYALNGAASLTDHDYLATALERLQPQFAALYERVRTHNLAVEPTEEDLDSVELKGYARGAFDELRDGASEGDAVDAQALKILYRMTNAG
ncbi:MAG: metallophosphoesterase [Corynebacterium glucuronolyticum]|nr:metallophosphoesterase [Corynebacterium glucuronolyticum]MDD7587734.1 metallophosphoesterase [Mycobacteriaceae bacterium]MDY5835053.1 metallophosphoesterase [Corynebacterium glucuronolyticum]